jgi:predicted RNase H-like nuclease (RuvC/YqgF family)|tara:strand:+ start:915 stop:1052 length:138 start_codon:yes stop_codon:yes gene_type:complete
MDIKHILTELDEVITKLKMKITYYQTENKKLKLKIIELKEYIGKL